MRLHFRPQLIPTVVAILLVAGMIKLGFWQYGKAEQKRALQATFDARLKEKPMALPDKVEDIEFWRYRRIVAKGSYETQFQILLDNQVENEQAGYHVITPLRPEGSHKLLLVDRGWIPMGDRSHLPAVQVPAATIELTGFAWVPSTKFFELMQPQESADWQPLWQNMDLARYAKASHMEIYPFVLRLDASSPSGGFVRNWTRPAERIETHIGYALQWWGFAIAVVAIWVFVTVRRARA